MMKSAGTAQYGTLICTGQEFSAACISRVVQWEVRHKRDPIHGVAGGLPDRGKDEAGRRKLHFSVFTLLGPLSRRKVTNCICGVLPNNYRTYLALVNSLARVSQLNLFFSKAHIASWTTD